MNQAPQTPEPLPIQARYLLLQGSTPVFVDEHGKRYLDQLWAIDARAHLAHLARFSIASPFVPVKAADSTMTPIDDDPLLQAIAFVPIPHARSRLVALAKLPLTFVRLWKAIGRADVVHVGIAGWPYPLGWLGVPIARVRGKRVIAVVESAPWRSAAGLESSLSQRLQASVYEAFGRAIVRNADLSFFTTQQYRQSLGGALGAHEHVIEATWIPQDQIIDDAALQDVLDARDANGGATLRMAFFGRLNAEKGIGFLVRALGDLPGESPVSLDVYGDGPDLPTLQQALSSDPRLARVRLCGTLSYGKALFARLRAYDYVVIPSFGDEQPRIVYDAFSQGVPVLASATAGLRQCVAEGETGFFFGVGDAAGLRRLLVRLCEPATRAARHTMAVRCIDVARSMTHAEMHRKRAELIDDFLRIKRKN